MNITDELFKLQDREYAKFMARSCPSVDSESIIGVKVPFLRSLAKIIIKEGLEKEFLNTLPHTYYEENLLHSILLITVKDYDECINYIDKFIPFIDNWAVCDTLRPRVFKKHKKELIKEAYKWIDLNETYSIRFGIDILMSEFLDNDFKEEYLYKVISVKSQEYYVNMMIAWYLATALIDHYDLVIDVLKTNKLDKWTHNKTIQKAIESYRIDDIKKEYLRTLRRN